MALGLSRTTKDGKNTLIIGEKIEMIFKDYKNGKLLLIFKDLTDEKIRVRRAEVAITDTEEKDL